MEKKPITHLNFLVPGVKALYDILVDQKHYFLPEFGRPATSQEYLYGIITGRIFAIKQDKIKPCRVIKKCTALDLFDIMKNLIRDLPLGFDETNMPDKEWMEKVIFSLSPDHAIFKESKEEVIYREIPKGIKLIRSILHEDIKKFLTCLPNISTYLRWPFLDFGLSPLPLIPFWI
jgi:hypothetical protein